MALISKIGRSAISPPLKSAINVFLRGSNLSNEGKRFSSYCYGTGSGGSNNDDICKAYLLGPGSGANNPGAPTMYDSRKLGHNLSVDNVCPAFEVLENIPTGVFRCTTGEVLGRGAGKCMYYQNPEYFSFHHMSFYDLNIGLRQYRLNCPKTGRKPN